jgi:Ca2+-binding RTX toxin-like protein
VTADGKFVLIDATASDADGAALLGQLESIGLQHGSAFGAVAGGLLPVAAVAELAGIANLAFASEAISMSNTGQVTSGGDHAMLADTARATYHVDGTGITVGVISDSFNALGGMDTDKSTNDLPANTTILSDYYGSDATDEGRAMAQIVHDVAPGASIEFATAYDTEASFANAIISLAQSGAKVIVDDVLYFAEPAYQDGIIAQAVNEVVKDYGVTYFSAASNDGHNGFESPFFGSGITTTVVGRSETFAKLSTTAGMTEFLPVKMAAHTGAYFVLDWAQPSASVSPGKGATSDLDLFLYNSTGKALANIDAYSDSGEPPYAITDNIGGNPKEILFYYNDTAQTQTVNLAVGLHSGSAPSDFKVMVLDNGAGDTLGTSTLNKNDGTVYGHAAASGAIAVGAADYHDTPAYGVNPPKSEEYSSGGPTSIYYDTNGNPLTTPDVRQAPAFTGPDGGATTVYGFDSFYGTSAAAPHAAAVAALMLQANSQLNAVDIENLMKDSSTDMDDPTTSGFDKGFDTATGAGLIQANLAVKYAETNVITADAGHTTILGTHLADTIHAGSALDTLTGGDGADVFVFAKGDSGVYTTTRDVITDFKVGVDKLDLSGVDQFRLLGSDPFDGQADALHIVRSGGSMILEGDINGDRVADFGITLRGNFALTSDILTPTSLLVQGPQTLTGKDGQDDTLIGGSENDTLSGLGGNDYLIGNGGDDVLNGGAGADRMAGGAGNDTYYVDDAGDVVTESANQGTDTVIASIDYQLTDQVENLTLDSAAGNIAGTGNGLANVIVGNAGNNVITGGAGLDTLTGGDGADVFVFAKGDSGVYTTTRDVITDFTIGVDKLDLSGVDQFRLLGSDPFDGQADALHIVRSGGSMILEGDINGDRVADFGITLRGNFALTSDILTPTSLLVQGPQTLTGKDGQDDTLIGGSENDTLSGLGGNDYLIGNAGDDVLNGGAGADHMDGGAGNDTYYVDNAGDKVTESTNQGTDTVIASIDYQLTDQVENLTLDPAAGNIAGTGNSLANVIVGNAGNNVITGGAGLDTLTGGDGADVFVFAKGDSGVYTTTRDVITDFTIGVDKLDLSGVDQFRFLGTAAFDGQADALHVVRSGGSMIIEGDINGDKVADFGITLRGNITAPLSDFTLDSFARPSTVTIVNDDDTSIDYSGIRPTVSAADDLNGDGYADFVIGLESSSNPNGYASGDAYVIYGTPARLSAGFSLADVDSSNGLKIWGSTAGESLGYGANTAGDFNGDGVSDLVLSAPWYSGSAGSNLTTAYLLYGGTTGTASPLDLSKLDSSAGTVLHGESNFEGGVGSVATVGDVNADGLDDIAVGAPNDNNTRGVAYVEFGSTGATSTDLTTLDGSTGFRMIGQGAFGALGQSVSGAGDINGDGIKDLVVSESAGGTFGTDNVAHVVFGHAGAFASSITPADLNGTNGFSVVGTRETAGYYFNQTISSAGDVNGDGYDDLIVGGAGSAFVVFGHGGTFGATLDVGSLNGTNGFEISSQLGQDVGTSVAAAGDLNGDGYADIIIGAPTDPGYGGDAGDAFVLYGHASGFSPAVDVTTLTSIAGHSLGDQLGWSVSGAGDIDGDGLDDLLVAAPGPEDGKNHGEVQVIYGQAAAGAIMGNDADNALNGTSAANVIIGAQGNDTIHGNGGADSIHGGSGDDQIHVSDNTFFRIDGGSGADTLHLDFAGTIDFGNLDGNAATSDRGKISNIETISVDNGDSNAMTLHLADVLDMDVRDTDVGGKASLDNVLKIDGNTGDTLHLSTADAWSAADTSTLAGYAIYTHDAVKIAIDTHIAVAVS